MKKEPSARKQIRMVKAIAREIRSKKPHAIMYICYAATNVSIDSRYLFRDSIPALHAALTRRAELLGVDWEEQ